MEEFDQFICAITKDKNEKLALTLLKQEDVLARVREQAAQEGEEGNYALQMAACNNFYDLCVELLKLTEVMNNAAVNDNNALRLFAANANIKGVSLLLEIPSVAANITTDNCYVLRIAADNSDLEMVKKLAKNPLIAAHKEGIKGSIKLAYKVGSKMVVRELHRLLGSPGLNLIQKKLRGKVQKALNAVKDDKLALAQVCKDLKSCSQDKAAKTLVYKLPPELWAKIAEFNLAPEVLKGKGYKKAYAPLYMFIGDKRNYAYLLDEAVDAVEKISAQQEETKKSLALKV